MKLFKYILSMIAIAVSVSSCVEEAEAPVGKFSLEVLDVQASLQSVKFRVKADFLYPIRSMSVFVTDEVPVISDDVISSAAGVEWFSADGEVSEKDGIWEFNVDSSGSKFKPNTTYYYWFMYGFIPENMVGENNKDYFFFRVYGYYMPPEKHTFSF